MKIFALLLAFITVSLSVVPCTDMHAQQSNMAQSIQEAQHHNHHAADSCTPFCQCNCCQGFVVVTGLTYCSQVPVFPKKHFSVYNNQDLSSISAIHWQPPKV
jgi:hypothetical protein